MASRAAARPVGPDFPEINRELGARNTRRPAGDAGSPDLARLRRVAARAYEPPLLVQRHRARRVHERARADGMRVRLAGAKRDAAVIRSLGMPGVFLSEPAVRDRDDAVARCGQIRAVRRN
jgi:hypothetical protein